MINPPSTFGQPDPAAPAPEPEAEPARKPRTVVIAAVAGVVALGVLGGAAALVLTTGDDDGPTLDSAPVPAVVEPVPQPSASTEVVAPLPVSAVRSRNIFVPLVAEASDSEAGAGGEEEAATDESGDDEDTEDTEETTSGTRGGSTQVVVDQAALQALQASEQQVAQLQRQITDLTTRLEAEGDDSVLEAELRELQEQYELLFKQAQDLKDALEALEVTVAIESVDTADPEALTATLLIDDVESLVDLDPATEDVPDTAVLGQTTADDDIVIRYVGYLPEDGPEPATVSLEVGSTLYTVAVGGELYFYLG